MKLFLKKITPFLIINIFILYNYNKLLMQKIKNKKIIQLLSMKYNLYKRNNSYNFILKTDKKT